MTQPPQGPPPGSGFPPQDGGYLPPGPGRPPQDGGYLPPEPSYVPPGESYPVEPAYPPGYVAGPPEPPRRPRRSSPIIAPVLAFVALLVVGFASYFVVDYVNATVDTAAAEASAEPTASSDQVTDPTDAPEPTDDPTATETEAPDDPAVVVDDTLPPEPESTAEPITVVPPSDQQQDVVGSILFTRNGGDIWVASGKTWSPLTNSSSDKADSNPTWSPDGKHIYFTRSTKKEVKDGKARLDGKYTLYPTDLLRMNADGSNRKVVLKSLINDSRGLWFRHVLQPAVSPAGNNVAVVSDGNDGAADGVELHVVNSKSGRMRKVDAPAEPAGQISLGHNDPDFNADGTKIAFTYNDNAGTEGDPRIAVLTCRTKSNCTNGKTKLLKPGYANPSWSPNGTMLAVEATDSQGRDIAIVNAKNGVERVRLTSDGDSFAPVFSPNGDQIAYLKREGQDINVRVMTLQLDEAGRITLADDRPVTSDGAVDGDSGLSWYVPKREQARSVDQDETAGSDSDDETTDDLLEGAPPPPGS